MVSHDTSLPNDAMQLDQTSSAVASAAQSIKPVERLLSSMKDLLETRLHSDSQLRQQTDENQEMMREWMIAAAVIDRICFIVFSLCFIVGTTVLFVLATCIERWQLFFTSINKVTVCCRWHYDVALSNVSRICVICTVRSRSTIIYAFIHYENSKTM